MQARRMCSGSAISHEVRKPLQEREYELMLVSNDPLPIFHPEFGRFMLEATPGKPWGIGFKDLLDVEPNMRRRLVLASLYMWILLNSLQAKDSQRTYGAQRVPDHSANISSAWDKGGHLPVLPTIRG